MFGMHGGMAYAHFLAGRYDMGVVMRRKVDARPSTFLLAICVYAASNRSPAA